MRRIVASSVVFGALNTTPYPDAMKNRPQESAGRLWYSSLRLHQEQLSSGAHEAGRRSLHDVSFTQVSYADTVIEQFVGVADTQ